MPWPLKSRLYSQQIAPLIYRCASVTFPVVRRRLAGAARTDWRLTTTSMRCFPAPQLTAPPPTYTTVHRGAQPAHHPLAHTAQHQSPSRTTSLPPENSLGEWASLHYSIWTIQIRSILLGKAPWVLFFHTGIAFMRPCKDCKKALIIHFSEQAIVRERVNRLLKKQTLGSRLLV